MPVEEVVVLVLVGDVVESRAGVVRPVESKEVEGRVGDLSPVRCGGDCVGVAKDERELEEAEDNEDLLSAERLVGVEEIVGVIDDTRGEEDDERGEEDDEELVVGRGGLGPLPVEAAISVRSRPPEANVRLAGVAAMMAWAASSSVMATGLGRMVGVLDGGRCDISAMARRSSLSKVDTSTALPFVEAEPSSLVVPSVSEPSSWRYMQSGLLQRAPLRKYEQYLVVPNEARRGRPSR